MVAYDDYGMPVGAYSEPETLAHQAYRVARAFFIYRVKPVAQRNLLDIKRERWGWKSLVTLVKVLVVVWCVVLFWGERVLFRNSINSCQWENWENWVCFSNFRGHLRLEMANENARLAMRIRIDLFSSQTPNLLIRTPILGGHGSSTSLP